MAHPALQPARLTDRAASVIVVCREPLEVGSGFI